MTDQELAAMHLQSVSSARPFNHHLRRGYMCKLLREMCCNFYAIIAGFITSESLQLLEMNCMQ